MGANGRAADGVIGRRVLMRGGRGWLVLDIALCGFGAGRGWLAFGIGRGFVVC